MCSSWQCTIRAVNVAIVMVIMRNIGSLFAAAMSTGIVIKYIFSI
ncbi:MULTISPECIES: hypothetical protein [unclassified Gilliamella]|nr:MULTISPECIES: hypothetical protein [unclassified Gilliamella]